MAVLLPLRRRRRGDRRELAVRAAHAARAPRRVAPPPVRTRAPQRLGREEVWRRAARRAAAVAGRRRRRAAAADCVAARGSSGFTSASRQTGHFSASGTGEAAAAAVPGRYSSLHFVAATPRARSGSGSIPSSPSTSRVCAPYGGAGASGGATRACAGRTLTGAKSTSRPAGWSGCTTHWNEPPARLARVCVCAARSDSSERSGAAATPDPRRAATHASAVPSAPKASASAAASRPSARSASSLSSSSSIPASSSAVRGGGAAATARASDGAAAARRAHVDGSKAWWAAGRSDAASMIHSPSAHS